MHLNSILFLLAGGLVVGVAVCVWGYSQRRKHLIARYGDPEIARRMMKREVWQGETREQLLESLGKPADIDQKVLATKTKELWKYRPVGKNRYALKITLDDGVVVGWEMKD